MEKKNVLIKVFIVAALLIAIIVLLILGMPKFTAQINEKRYNEVIGEIYNYYYLIQGDTQNTIDFSITKDNAINACSDNLDGKDFYVYVDKDKTYVITKINNKEELFEFKNKRLVAFPGQILTLECNNKTYASSIDAIYSSKENEIEAGKSARKAQEQLEEMEKQKQEYEAKYGNKH